MSINHITILTINIKIREYMLVYVKICMVATI